jgi:WD40 repeat protein
VRLNGFIARWAIAAIAVALSQTVPASAEVRIALVIGNGAYQHVPTLPNPRNDATDVAAALKRAGFETIVGTDLDWDKMVDAEIRFARAARGADVALFYYSGHAMQFNGINYLAPVDAVLKDESDLRRMTRVDDIVSDLQQAKNLHILVLDSCRDNPLAEELRRSIGATRAMSLQRGLAKIETPLGTIVSFATQSGQTAEDGQGRNSPYTTAFLKHIDEQQEIGTIFREVSEDVYQTTAHQQLPELSLSIIGQFYLRGRVEVTVQPAAPVPAAPVDTTRPDFEAAERVDTVTGWDAFLRVHPDGFYATLAQERRTKAAKLASLPSSGAGPSTVPSSNPVASPTSPVSISPPPKAVTPTISKAPSNLASVREKYRGWTVVPRFGIPVTAVALSADGRRIVSGTDRTIKIWDATDGSLLNTGEGHSLSVTSVAISPDLQYAVSGSNDKTVKIWDMSTGRRLGSLEGHTFSVTAVAISPDSRTIVSGSADRTIKVWDAATGKLLRTWEADALSVNALAISADGSRIVSGGSDKTVKIWDAASGNLVRTLQGPTERVRAVAISVDGSRVAEGGDDNRVIVWDAASGVLLRSLGYQESINAIAFSPDGRRIVSASDDYSVRFWDAESGELFKTLEGHQASVRSVAISSDGGRVISGSSDNSIKIWDVAKAIPLMSLTVFNPRGSAVIRADGTFWTSEGWMSNLRLVRETEQQPVPDDYKAAFMREKPFDDSVAVAK